ncbi:hypothetical protein V6N13_010683 [Hibiscus sabdariffa]|uniref:Uncharacterized protein n=2 Tax=Hibiscus sabdariffa TaxID=183260 RepID=A0ABR2AKK8_9ROSI
MGIIRYYTIILLCNSQGEDYENGDGREGIGSPSALSLSSIHWTRAVSAVHGTHLGQGWIDQVPGHVYHQARLIVDQVQPRSAFSDAEGAPVCL